MPKMNIIKFAKEDQTLLLKCIQQRSGDEMYKLADKLQAGNLLNSLGALEYSMDRLRDLDINAENYADLQKTIQDITRLSGVVTTALDKLVLSATTRPVEKTIDPLVAMLNKVDYGKHCPPELRKEFILANEDQDRTDGKITELITGENKEDVIKELVQPITAYVEKPKKEIDNIVTFNKGLREL